jgi:DNA polymerase-3 subunit epsilon
MSINPETLAQQLEQHPDFKILRRLPIREVFFSPAGEAKIKKGIVLDTETTGMQLDSDRVIELGMLLFEFDAVTGRIFKIIKAFDQLEDPGFPIPPESTQVHHITDEMVRGKSIDDDEVASMLQDVSVVIAHNAGFDRPFVEARWPVFENMHWACSLRDINWQEEGLGSAKLEYLLYKLGYFYDAHRAEMDCRALLEMLNCLLPQSQTSALLRLLESMNQPQVKLTALNSPFETKDLLKTKGYRWDAQGRCWFKQLASGPVLEEEKSWLKQRIYSNRNDARVEIETMGSKVRYSKRAGERQQIQL